MPYPPPPPSAAPPGVPPAGAAIEERNRVLRSVGVTPVDTAAAQGKWAQFQDALEAHAHLLGGQLEKLRGSLGLSASFAPPP